jgi:hypothetical protein
LVTAFAVFLLLVIRVARWFVFKPKIPIWVNFGESCHGKSWYILWPFGLFNGYWKHFMAIWYIFPRFGILDQKSGNPACHSHLNIRQHLAKGIIFHALPCISHCLHTCREFSILSPVSVPSWNRFIKCLIKSGQLNSEISELHKQDMFMLH